MEQIRQPVEVWVQNGNGDWGLLVKLSMHQVLTAVGLTPIFFQEWESLFNR
jgi:hypothetical protein